MIAPEIFVLCATTRKLTQVRSVNIGRNCQFWDRPCFDSVTAAQSARAELKTMIKSIEDRKVAIQLAADAEWPHTDETNAAIRREFGLAPRKTARNLIRQEH